MAAFIPSPDYMPGDGDDPHVDAAADNPCSRVAAAPVPIADRAPRDTRWNRFWLSHDKRNGLAPTRRRWWWPW